MTVIDDAIQQLQRHRGLVKVGEAVARQDFTDVEVDVKVELPSRAREAGISATGVRTVEKCVLRFDKGWPVSAPRPLLRVDFPLNLPHINPHIPGQLVSPCLFDGSLDELLHRFGLDAVVDQLVDWLHRAAGGTLIDAAQGWEPMRRDNCPSIVVVSAERVVAAVPKNGSVFVARADYFTVPSVKGVHATLNPEILHDADVHFDQKILKLRIEEVASGTAAAFVVRAPAICSSYQPDSVSDYESLLSLAAAFGIDRDVLRNSIDDYYRRSVLGVKSDPRTWSHGMFGVVILLVERPVPLIGAHGRNVELLPYVIQFDISAKSPLTQKVSVHPASHAHALSPQLLAMTSGVANPHKPIPMVMFGCGSVGSKIALHLGRSGIGQMTFVDNEMMSPHNMARHALTVSTGYKADLMRAAFESLSNESCRAFHNDAVDVFGNAELFSEIVPSGDCIVVDATASLKVLAAETMSSELDQSSARLVRVALYGQGRCGVALPESQRRACRVDDLTAHLFERCRSDLALRTQMAGDTTEPVRVFVGDNCRSVTARMSDARISRSSALFALQFERWLMSGFPSEAKIGVAVADDTNVGMCWQEGDLGTTVVLFASQEGGWHIRLLEPVAQFIQKDSRLWSPKETGGALLGRVNYTNRTITIAGAVDAPPDSIRERTRFLLGTEGLVQSLRRAHADSVGYLSFIGTWHSHPAGGMHSGIDRQTLSRIAQDAGGMPAVSLIWTPTGFSCAVERW